MKPVCPTPIHRAALCLLFAAGAVNPAAEGQTYRVDALGDLTDREVRIIQTNSAGTDVHIFDPKTMEMVAHLEGIDVPHGATLHPDGLYYYFTNEHDATVDVVDTRTLERVDRIPLAARPNNLSSSDRARKLYVAIIAEPLVQVIDMDTHEVIRDIPAAGGVHNTFVTPDGRYAVAGMIGASTMMAIDTETDEVVWEEHFESHSNPFTGGVRPFAFTTHPDGSTRWILVNIGGWHGFWVLDWETREVLRKISPADDAWLLTDQTGDGIQSAPSHGIVVLPDQSALWHSSRATSHIYGWSLPDFGYLGRVHIGNPAWLTATPDSRYVWVGVASHRETAVVDVERQEVIRRFPVGHAPKRIYTAVFPEGWEGEVVRADGDGGLGLGPTAEREGEEAVRTASGSTPAQGLDFRVYREVVEPVFLRPRGGFVGSDAPCVACHTHQTSTPLDLETPRTDGEAMYWTEEQSRRNLEAVARLVDPADVENSRLLRAPLTPLAGGRRHSGGVFWTSTDDPEWRAIADWIGSASAEAAEREPQLSVDFEFFHHCVQPVFLTRRDNGVECAHCHGGEFAPVPGDGRDRWSEEESRRAFEVLQYYLEPGHPERSRFLNKPLHPEAGGDLMHNGVRRWISRDDPEWQALAEWVRGEAAGSSCPPALRSSGPSPS